MLAKSPRSTSRAYLKTLRDDERFLRVAYRTLADDVPEHRCRGIREAWLDRVAVDPGAISLVDDGGVHHIRAVIGRPKDKVEAEVRFAANGQAG